MCNLGVLFKEYSLREPVWK